ncbi:3-oxoacyl-ACP synthase III [Nakamurella flavida]|uniref:3-oxoacyl-ACP synthase III n=1 Tax=Nakamurella flavida TaxID=363630 RepID=A0A939C639_9ACTN|nr:3-oxoacyl-ACP synthase III [Nakamurella flavida]MBM9477599.1 3-oxoacyl-ACP synthase III [Nakamurella flavida]MDP9779147.1 3-oxoacyl-[acyl-carrier-protein] synthase-3 [Nakamurella flavida]
MAGNAIHRFANTTVLAVCAIDAPRVVTSAEIDERLADVYTRVSLRPGMMQRLAGIAERRWWEPGTTYADGAAMAGAKAMAEAGVNPSQIGLMVNTSVSRAHLEPSTAVAVHHALGLPSSCQNFDVTNACLGFVNGMQLAAAMIESGQIDYALVVNGEDAREMHESTIRRLQEGDGDAREVFAQFASLTLGSGAAAMVLGRADLHPEGHRFLGGATRAGSEHHMLCVGDMDDMRTDSTGLMTAGMELSTALWEESAADFGWDGGMDRYVMHQVSNVHTKSIIDALGLDADKAPLTFPTRGNMGPAAIPFTLATVADELTQGDRVLLMGIGSGLNASFAEIVW